VRVTAATLPPFEGALEGTPFAGHYSPSKEQLRARFNGWIRGSGAFDAVIDFDALLRDPAHPGRMRPRFDSGDHLHPGDAGYRAMARHIDISAFTSPTSARCRRTARPPSMHVRQNCLWRRKAIEPTNARPDSITGSVPGFN
jgi:hypothetical protein